MSNTFVGDNDHGDTPLPPLSDLLWEEVTKLRQEVVRLNKVINELKSLDERNTSVKNSYQKFLVKISKDSKDIIENLVIHILETNKTTKINTPPHECEFGTDPERGKCSFCETWGSAIMLVYPNQSVTNSHKSIITKHNDLFQKLTQEEKTNG